MQLLSGLLHRFLEHYLLPWPSLIPNRAPRLKNNYMCIIHRENVLLFDFNAVNLKSLQFWFFVITAHVRSTTGMFSVSLFTGGYPLVLSGVGVTPWSCPWSCLDRTPRQDRDTPRTGQGVHPQTWTGQGYLLGTGQGVVTTPQAVRLLRSRRRTDLFLYFNTLNK